MEPLSIKTEHPTHSNQFCKESLGNETQDQVPGMSTKKESIAVKSEEIRALNTVQEGEDGIKADFEGRVLKAYSLENNECTENKLKIEECEEPEQSGCIGKQKDCDAGDRKLLMFQNVVKTEKVEEIDFHANTERITQMEGIMDAFVKLERIKTNPDLKDWTKIAQAPVNKKQKLYTSIDELWNPRNIMRTEESVTSQNTEVRSRIKTELTVIREPGPAKHAESESDDDENVESPNESVSDEDSGHETTRNGPLTDDDGNKSKMKQETKSDDSGSDNISEVNKETIEVKKEIAAVKKESVQTHFKDDGFSHSSAYIAHTTHSELESSVFVINDKKVRISITDQKSLEISDLNLRQKFQIANCYVSLKDLCLDKLPVLKRDFIILDTENIEKKPQQGRNTIMISNQCLLCKTIFENRQSLVNHERSHRNNNSECSIGKGTYHSQDDLLQHIPHQCLYQQESNKCENNPNQKKLHSHNLKRVRQKPHQCNACNKSYATPKELEEHNNTHGNIFPFKCKHCGRAFTGQKRLYCHQISVHAVNRRFSCEKCGKAFKRKTGLQCHMIFHTNERAYKCPDCDKTYRYKASLSLHKRTHTGEFVVCEICKKKFRDPGDLKKHYDVHYGVKTLQCDHCRKFFRTKSFMVNHVSFHFGPDTLDKQHLCSFCGKRFMYPSALREHQKIHSKEKTDICDKCGKAFSLKVGLKSHIKRMHGDAFTCKKERIICDICRKTFRTIENFRRHRKSHTDTFKYRCKFCDKSYAFTYRLKRHVDSAHKNVKRERVRCDICNASVTKIKQHMLVHDDKAPFGCPVCGKCFKRRPGLYTHMAVHMEKKPWVCDTCGQGCTQLGALKLHIKRKH